MMLPGAFPREMRGPFFTNGLNMKKAVFPDAPFGQQRFRPVSERAAQPAIERNAETGFRSVDQRVRYEAAKQFAENPFPPVLAELHGHGQPPRELNHTMVKQWDSRFAADSHAAAVHF